MVHNCAGALREVRPHAHAVRQAALRRPLHKRLRSSQVVKRWCQADESEAWGEAATPRSAVLSQYYTGLSAVLVWLYNRPKLPDVLASGPAASAPDATDGGFTKCADCYWVRVVTRPCSSSPCTRHLASLVLPAAAPARRRGAVRGAVPGRQGAACRIPGGLLQRPRERPPAQHHGARTGRVLRCGGAAASKRCGACICWQENAS